MTDQNVQPSETTDGPPPPPPPQFASDDVRKANLSSALSQAVQHGWRVENQGDFNAAIAKGKKPNHILHLLLTIFTAGLWLIVWLILGLSKKENRRLLVVDQFGNVTG